MRFDDLSRNYVAAIEDVHYGAAVVDWARVAHLTRRLRQSVSEMVTRLARLSPSRHLDLAEYARRWISTSQMPWTCRPGTWPALCPSLADVAGDAATAGGKAPTWPGRAQTARVPVPPGFVVTTAAFRISWKPASWRPKINRQLRRVDLSRRARWPRRPRPSGR